MPTCTGLVTILVHWDCGGNHVTNSHATKHAPITKKCLLHLTVLKMILIRTLIECIAE